MFRHQKLRIYLHSIEGQVAGDFKLLHQHLLFHIVDAHKLGLSSCQNRLTICRVAQTCKGPDEWINKKNESKGREKEREREKEKEVFTHFPLAECLAVILSVSLRPIARSWRPATEPVCVAESGFQKVISPFKVATANS